MIFVLSYRGYEGEVDLSKCPHLLVGYVCHVPLRITFTGWDYVELTTDFHRRVDEYIEKTGLDLIAKE